MLLASLVLPSSTLSRIINAYDDLSGRYSSSFPWRVRQIPASPR